MSDFQPRKRFGQHFLRDLTVIQQILEVFSPKASEHLVEIGPGEGALTLPLLEKTGHLEAVELDRDLIAALERRASNRGDLVIYSADALKFDFASLRRDDRLLRIIGNLPYNISTPLIFHLLTFTSCIADMLLMLQKEVAERLTALPHTKRYGRLSVMVQYHCQVEGMFDVRPGAFYPPPQVQSSMVHLTPYRSLPYVANDYVLFESIVRQAFQQRRKTLRNSLKQIIDDAVWAHISLHSDLRAENVSVKDFVEMSNAVSRKGGS